MNVPEGIVEVSGFAGLLNLTLGTECDGHRSIGGVVVHITHDEQLHVGVFGNEGILHGTDLTATELTIVRYGTARG